MKISSLATASIAPDAVLAFKPNPQEKKVLDMTGKLHYAMVDGERVAVEEGATRATKVNLGEIITKAPASKYTDPVDDRAISKFVEHVPEVHEAQKTTKVLRVMALLNSLVNIETQARAVQVQDVLVVTTVHNRTSYYKSDDISKLTGANFEGLDDFILKALVAKAQDIQQALNELGVVIDVYELLDLPSYAD